MLDLKNIELVDQWLNLCPDGVSAAVFVNDRDELCVRADGIIELFDTSPFKHQRMHHDFTACLFTDGELNRSG
jgi:hypothetical protein